MGPRYVSTTQVAEALGVSVTTVKRWVDEGILPAHKTAGGHRKLLLADVLRVVREEKFPRLDLSRLDLPPEEAAGDPPCLLRDLFAALERGDAAAARSVIAGAYQRGLAVEAIADAVVAPAMHRVGDEWQAGRIDVWHEHRATQVCAAVLCELKAEIERDSGVRPVAVGGGPEGDPYLLANLLAQVVLLDAGWEAVNLGPNTPLASFRRAVDEFRPRLLWLSVSFLPDAGRFALDYEELYRAAERAGTAVVLGGQALTETARDGLPSTTLGDNLTHLATFARTLHPRPHRPRRGRPPGS